MRTSVVLTALLTALLVLSSAAVAQVEDPHEISIQGTGFFTKDSHGNGISQHSTDTGGLLVGYRYHLTRWLAAEANYGYDRNTLQNFTSAGAFNIQSDVHQATGALVFALPGFSHLRPYALAGAGALVFDPTLKVGEYVAGADRQAKAAFVYGGGADFKVSNHIFLRAEYRGLVYKRPDFYLNSLNSDQVAHTAQPSAGIVIRF